MKKSFPVLILNWMRPGNIRNHILPALMKEDIVSKIIIAHGNPETIFGVEKLADGEIIRQEKVWHIGNYASNTALKCFRRWELIRRLRREGLLEEECILVQDDDIVFNRSEIEKFIPAYEEKKGILITGSGGRNIVSGKYVLGNIYGKCDITIGQSIYGNIDTICKAVDEIYNRNIPSDLYIYEDDITISYFTLTDGNIQNKQHYCVKLNMRHLPQNNAVSMRPDHLNRRNRTLTYLLNTQK